MRSFECRICGHIYSEADGDPLHGIPPGTKWEDLPEDWVCPDCGASKTDYELMEG